MTEEYSVRRYFYKFFGSFFGGSLLKLNGNKMVVTDLDGTLLHAGTPISRTDINTLIRLKNRNSIRVIATGRSLYSAYHAIEKSMPIDYLIFSSGAGIIEWKTGKILKTHSMKPQEVNATARFLLQKGLDFMIHDPIPDNHVFTYFQINGSNPDFNRRIEYYREFAVMGNTANPELNREACQIVAVEPCCVEESSYSMIARELRRIKVIRTTSPMDGRSTWLELFPKPVSKASAAEYLCSLHGIDQADVMALGNDYNDMDLLSWAGTSFVVSSAPDELLKNFPAIRGGLSKAVDKWLG